jgi:hypothetical protein
MAALGDSTDLARGVPRIPSRGILLRRIDDVDQMMRNSLLLFDGNFVGTDVEAAIHRGRIARDDLAAEAARERYRKGALSRGRRADDRNERRARQGQKRRAIAYTAIAENAR